MKQPCVYILASKPNGTLYVGVTTNLTQRIYQHKAGDVDGFSKRYDINRLVFYELHEDTYHAIVREKQVKAWETGLVDQPNSVNKPNLAGFVSGFGVMDPSLR